MENQVVEEINRFRKARRRVRAAAFGVAGMLVLGVTGYLLAKALRKPEPPPMADNVIDIAADMGGFNQKVVRVRVGEPVTVRLWSLNSSRQKDGGGKHQWVIDELGVDIVAPPMGSSYKTFTPVKVGTYTFYCDICCGGRANPNMSGSFVVVG